MLSLFPLDPRGSHVFGWRDARAGKPCLDDAAELGLASKPERERKLAQLDAELAPELGKRPQLVQLADAVPAGAGGGAARDDETRGVEVAQHAGRPAGPPARLTDRGRRLHAPTLPQMCEGSTCCFQGRKG